MTGNGPRRGSEAPKPTAIKSVAIGISAPKSITTRFDTVKSSSAPVRTRADSYSRRKALKEEDVVFVGCPSSVEKQQRDSGYLKDEDESSFRLSDDEDDGLAKKTSNLLLK